MNDFPNAWDFSPRPAERGGYSAGATPLCGVIGLLQADGSAGFFRIGYHNWFLVAFYIAVVGVFVFGILRPRRRTEWRSAGLAQGWVIALYAEMYGLPLTMYLVAWLTGKSEYATDHFLNHYSAPIIGALIFVIVFSAVHCRWLGCGGCEKVFS